MVAVIDDHRGAHWSQTDFQSHRPRTTPKNRVAGLLTPLGMLYRRQLTARRARLGQNEEPIGLWKPKILAKASARRDFHCPLHRRETQELDGPSEEGVAKGRKWTEIAYGARHRPPDRVWRRFRASRLNQLGVADIALAESINKPSRPWRLGETGRVGTTRSRPPEA